jgi:uncharacterized membrane protein (UPF0127 family)
VTWLLALACAREGLPTTRVEVGGTTVTVEVADDEGERAMGLMYRDHLDADAGMLFVYPDALERRFWMKDTRVPLAIAFLAADGTIVRIAEMKPLDRNTTPSGAPAMYALEMNKGWFTAHGVKQGDRVGRLPVPPPPAPPAPAP